MAELLVRVVDSVNKDFYLNIQASKRGDVIAVCPDGWLWGNEELKNPDWRIIRTDMPLREAQQLLLGETPKTQLKDPAGARMLQFRARKIDLDAVADQALQAQLADVSVAPYEIDIATTDTPTKETILARSAVKTPIIDAHLIRPALVLKESIQDPSVFGDDEAVFG